MIKNKYPGTSLLDFFKRFNIQYRNTYYDNQGYTIKIDRTDYWQTYVLTSTNCETTEDYIDWDGLGVFGGCKDWDVTVKIKAISITDPECREQDVVINTYDLCRYYLYGIHADTDKFDQTYYGRSFLYIDRK